jgi:cytochrome c-type biogenesis protein CcmF
VFRSWTVLLAILAFSLSLLGTFLVRSGVLTSVHAFATDPARGVFILVFLALVVGGSLTLFAWRAGTVGLGGGFEVMSRESSLLANNILLVVAMASVLLGTLYPLFLDAMNLGKISVGPPYFDAVFYPLLAPALFLMGVGPIARWRAASLPELTTRLKWALAVAVVSALVLPFVLGRWTPLIAVGLFLALWIVATTVVNLKQRLAGSHRHGVLAKLAANPASYYGMLLAHLGVALFVVGVTLVKGYESEQDVRVTVGETIAAGGYEFKFLGVTPGPGPNYRALVGTVEVRRDGKLIETLRPEKRIYNASGQTMTIAAIATTLFGDRYVSLGEPLANDDVSRPWSVRIYLKPFVDWIWFGAFLMALGGFIAVGDRRYRLAAKSRRTEAADAAGAAAE